MVKAIAAALDIPMTTHLKVINDRSSSELQGCMCSSQLGDRPFSFLVQGSRPYPAFLAAKRDCD